MGVVKSSAKFCIVPRDQWGRLPAPRAAELNGMVFSLQIENERTSPTRYLATLTVNFRRDAIRNLLQRSQIAFAETATRPVLVVPVYNSAGAQLLWDDPNPWRQSWSIVRERNSLSPMVIANGDLTDVGLISAAQAASGDRARLAALAQDEGEADEPSWSGEAENGKTAPNSKNFLPLSRGWQRGYDAVGWANTAASVRR